MSTQNFDNVDYSLSRRRMVRQATERTKSINETADEFSSIGGIVSQEDCDALEVQGHVTEGFSREMYAACAAVCTNEEELLVMLALHELKGAPSIKLPD